MIRQISLILYKANLFFNKQRNVKFFANSGNTKITCAQSNVEIKRTRAKSSYDTCDEARRAKSEEIIW